jgi:hypothetical protein
MPPDVFGCVVIYLLEFFGRAENVSSIVKFDIKNLMGRNIQPMASLQKKISI